MKIVVLGGGTSTERDVSLATSMSVCKALRAMGHQAIFVDLYLGLEDYFGSLKDIFDVEDGFCNDIPIGTNEPSINEVVASRKETSSSRIGKSVLDVCRMADIVFIGLHGKDGEDGKIQATFDLLGIPYTGADCLACAMAMDKAVTKHIMDCYSILTPEWREVKIREDKVETIIAETEVPCVVKAINGGSSIGVMIANTREELACALQDVQKYGSRILIEGKKVGREITVPVLGETALDPIEIIPPGKGCFDYVAKYQPGKAGADEICPAKIDKDTAKRLRETALSLHNALGLSVYSRTDFILDGKGQIWCLEINALPGLTPNSLLPKAAKVRGLILIPN